MNSYLEWAQDFQLPPFPVDEVKLSAWVVDVASCLSYSTILSYISGIKFCVPTFSGERWSLDGNVMVKQATRYVRKKYGSSGKGAKFPICLKAIRRFLPLLPGWPDGRLMSHDDNLFACATLIATMAFLRGGEFLWSTKSTRPMLRGAHLIVRMVMGAPIVVVLVQVPKNCWWEEHLEALCFPLAGRGEFCPLRRLAAYRSNSVVELDAGQPAFRLANGKPLSRDWMVNRTASLLQAADMNKIDSLGQPVDVRASSWRAGGVRSATDANLAEPIIMALGRWKSAAWSSYVLYGVDDLKKAAASMWREAQAVSHGGAEAMQPRVENTHHGYAGLDVELLGACIQQARRR
jgi:hypothetical protein